MWQKLRKLDTRLTPFGELERRAEQFSLLGVEVDLQRVGMRFAVLPGEFRFGIEQVHLARAAMLEQADDRLGLARMVWLLRCERIVAPGTRICGSGKVRQRQRTQPAGVAGHKSPAIQ